MTTLSAFFTAIRQPPIQGIATGAEEEWVDPFRRASWPVGHDDVAAFFDADEVHAGRGRVLTGQEGVCHVSKAFLVAAQFDFP